MDAPNPNIERDWTPEEKKAHEREVQKQLKSLPILLTETQVSGLTSMAVSTLRKKRGKGYPPKFHKIGNRVRYKLQDVLDYIDSNIGGVNKG